MLNKFKLIHDCPNPERSMSPYSKLDKSTIKFSEKINNTQKLNKQKSSVTNNIKYRQIEAFKKSTRIHSNSTITNDENIKLNSPKLSYN